MTIYVPGVAETDPKKQNRSLQQLGTATSTNTTNVATNTANIATNTADIATNTTNIATNTANIATNTATIATNTANIATNTTNIATNTTAIAALQASTSKAWLHYRGTGTPAILASFNVASVTRTGTGLYTITWTIPFSSANYAVVGMSNDNTSGVGAAVTLETISASTINVLTFTPSTLAAADAAHLSIVAFGTQ